MRSATAPRRRSAFVQRSHGLAGAAVADEEQPTIDAMIDTAERERINRGRGIRFQQQRASSIVAMIVTA
jgi:hypothetical protein